MHSATSNRNTWLCTIAMVVLTIAACASEYADVLTPARMTLHRLMSPGRLAVLALTSPADQSDRETTPELSLTNSEVADLQDALLQNELQRRQLLIQNARLHNELRSMKRLAGVRSVTEPGLTNFVTVSASVLSRTGLPGTLKSAFIDLGASQGLERSQLVVEGSGLLLDRGEDQGLSVGQKVIHGTAVVGRIVDVSNWVGLVQPVTHVDFSSAVQIVKMAPQGASFGAKGLLEGTGDGQCRISGIPYTEAVAVGDEVFSADINGVNGPRLYYGIISHAEFSAGGQWDIRVETAFRSDDLNTVAVVQQKVNPERGRAVRNDFHAGAHR